MPIVIESGLGSGTTPASPGCVSACSAWSTIEDVVSINSDLSASSLSAPTLLVAATTAASEAAIVSGSFTPTADALILVLVTLGTSAGTNPTSVSIADTLGGLVWTKIEQQLFNGGNSTLVAIFYAKASDNPTSGTVTVTPSSVGGANAGMTLTAYQVVGADSVGATGSAAQAAAITLSSAPATTSMVVSLFESYVGTNPAQAVPAGYAALYTADRKTGVNLYDSAAYKLGSAASIVTWSGNASLTNNAAGIAIEITQASTMRNAIIRSLLWSTDMLYDLSGRRWPGSCEDTVTPYPPDYECCGSGLGGMLYGVGWANGLFDGSGLAGFFDRATNMWLWNGCRCRESKLYPGVYPLTGVSQILIDGVPLDPSAYAIRNSRWLVRTDGLFWPQKCDSMQVTMSYGYLPPPGGVASAAILAGELALALAGKTCRLPSRTQTITRQGVTLVKYPTDLIAKGRTGLPEVDLWLASVNPKSIRQRSTILSPDRRASVKR